MIKGKINMEELNPSYNHPKTYAIVYKGTKDVVKYGNTLMFFRSKKTADDYIYILEKAFLIEEIELIQLRLNKYSQMLSDRLGTEKNTNPRKVTPRTCSPYINKTGRTNKK